MKQEAESNIKCYQNWIHTNAVHLGIIFPCDLCDYNALHRGDLKRHVISKHLGTNFPCDQYSFQTSSKSYLNIHKNSIHNGLRPCDLCWDYTGQTNHALKYVEGNHLGLQHLCLMCESKFKLKSYLNMHI